MGELVCGGTLQWYFCRLVHVWLLVDIKWFVGGRDWLSCNSEVCKMREDNSELRMARVALRMGRIIC